MFSPGADGECLNEMIGVSGILIETPMEGARAAAYSPDLLHGVNERLMILGEHTISDGHEHWTVLRAGIQGQVTLGLIEGGAQVEGLYAMQAPAKGSEDAHAEAESRNQEGGAIAEPIREGSPGEAAESHKALEDEQIDAEGARSYPVGSGVLGSHVETGHHCHPRQAAQSKCGQQ